MTISYELQDRLLIIRQNHVTDSRAIVDIMARALSDPKLLPQSLLLWDATHSPATISASDMHKMIDGLNRVTDKIEPRCAVLVENSRQFGVSRMLEAYSDFSGISTKTFYDFEEAKTWLTGRGD